MGLVQNDLDKRILAEFARQNAAYRNAMRDADVIREMAEIWFDSGGESDGLDEEYIGKIKAEIKRLEGMRVEGLI